MGVHNISVSKLIVQKVLDTSRACTSRTYPHPNAPHCHNESGGTFPISTNNTSYRSLSLDKSRACPSRSYPHPNAPHYHNESGGIFPIIA